MRYRNPYIGNQRCETFLRRVRPLLDDIKRKPLGEITRIFYRLRSMQETCHPRAQMYYGVMVCNIKDMLKLMGETAKHEHRKHKMTDHAFIRVLELIHGLDIDDLKNRAITDLETSRYVGVEAGANNQIVTILRRDTYYATEKT